MKRIYDTAAAIEVEGGFAVVLDDRPLKTPAKRSLSVPNRALAEAVAAEWQAQDTTIRRETMPLTRLVYTALDRVAERLDEVVEEVARYAETDLLCYRAERPTELARRQHTAWQPLLDWAARRYGAALAVTTGLTPTPQDPGTIGALRAAVAALNALSLTGLHGATAASGSLVIGLALFEGEIDAETAWRAAQIDETYQSESWGEDQEAAAQRQARRRDLLAAARFMIMCRI